MKYKFEHEPETYATVAICAVGVLLAIGLFACMGWIIISDWNDCSNRGGAYVRSAIWFECVQKK